MMTFNMGLFKRGKRNVVASSSHYDPALRNRYGKKVSALIQSQPVRRFDDAYRSDLHGDDPDYLIFEDEDGNRISKRKFKRLAKKKMKG